MGWATFVYAFTAKMIIGVARPFSAVVVTTLLVLLPVSTAHSRGRDLRPIDPSRERFRVDMNGPKYDNTWAVKINGDEERAREIAEKHGFVYLNKVYNFT